MEPTILGERSKNNRERQRRPLKGTPAQFLTAVSYA
jgi:hypothetical protein